MAETKKFLDLVGLGEYDAKIKEKVATDDATTLQSAKTYADGLAVNYDPAGTATTKVNELKNGAVKTNTDAIAAINNTTTGILAKAKTYADGKDAAIAAAKKAGTDAQADVDALEKKVGTVPEGQTVIGIISNIQENAYDDTDIKKRISANETAIATLNGNAEGSVNKKVADAVASIVADAPEAYNTLKEISDWISSHAGDASAMNTQITTNKNSIAALKTLVGSLPEGAASKTVVAYIAEVVGASKTELTSAIATAKSEAIATSKTYADGLAKNYATAAQGAKADSALQKSSIATGKTNGSIAVGGTDVAVKGLGSAAYAATSAFDAAGTADTKVTALANGAVKTNTTNITALQGKVATLESTKYTPITKAEIDALFTAQA